MYLQKKTFTQTALRFLREGFQPIPQIKAWEWGEKHRVLRKSEGSNEEGPLSFRRTPYGRKISEALSVTSSYNTVIFKKASQIGGTEIGNTWLAYLIDIEPGDIGQVYSNDKFAQLGAEKRVIPMLENTPVLRPKLIESRSKSKKEKWSIRRFLNGSIRFLSAQRISDTKSFPFRYLHLTEVDDYSRDLKGQGDVVDLLEARQRTLGTRRKTFIESTPTRKGFSKISDLFEDTDQQHYHITCPHCNHKQHLRFEQLRWHTEETESGQTINYPGANHYECESCEGKIYESQKPELLEAGEWISLNPSKTSRTKIGFHINSLYSPLGWFSWADLIQKFIDAGSDPNKLKTFYNTILGLEFESEGELPAWETIYRKKESWELGTIPSIRCLFLTGGADVQGDRIELYIRGWGRNSESWLIDKKVFYGDTSDLNSDGWRDLRDFLDTKKYKHPAGTWIPISTTALDISYRTSVCLSFVKSYPLSKVLPVMGRDTLSVIVSMPKTTQSKGYKKKATNNKRVYINTTLLKEEFYGFIQLEKESDTDYPIGYIHLPTNIDEESIRQMLSERMIYEGNKLKFERIRRNEALDCFGVYARAAAIARGILDWSDKRWTEIESVLGIKADPEEGDSQSGTGSNPDSPNSPPNNPNTPPRLPEEPPPPDPIRRPPRKSRAGLASKLDL